MLLVAAGNVVVWVAARPLGQPTGVLLFSCSLALATLLPVIERAFGGLDRVTVWHRHAATAGLLHLLHWGLATSAPDPMQPV